MSYEGYREYILADGRYVVNDAYEDEVPEGAVWVHSVDVTYGYDGSLPDCCDAPKEERGVIEHEHFDFKGNRYFTRESIYSPVGPEWHQLVPGFLSTLTPEQRTEALKGFDGDDTLGDPASLKGEGE